MSNPNFQDGSNQTDPEQSGENRRPVNPYWSATPADGAPNSSPAPNPYTVNPYQSSNPYASSANPYSNPYQTNLSDAPSQNPYSDGNGYVQAQGASVTGVRPRAVVPYCTYVLLAIIGLVFVGQMTTGGSFDGRDLDEFMAAGGLIEREVRAGEWWRLITPIFLHFGVTHLLFNAIALFVFGMQLEALIGRVRFVTIFFLSGLGGNVLALLLQKDGGVTAGASGAIFGLMGALIGFFLLNRANTGAWGQANLRSLLITAGINLVFTISIPNISLGGHLGGAIVGLFLGYFMSPLLGRIPAGATPQSSQIQPRNLIMTIWPVLAVLAVEIVVVFLILQGTPTPTLRIR